MIAYIVQHHAPGRIDLDVPALRSAEVGRIRKISEVMTGLPIFMGIRGLSVSLGDGRVAIEYDAEILDIMAYLDDVAAIAETLAEIGA